MNYASDVVLPIPLFNVGVSVNDIPKVAHTKLDPNIHINPDLLKFFSEVGLYVNFAETFYMRPYANSIIHCDTKHYTDVAKINYVFDGKDSTMNWYHTKDDALRNTTPSIIGSNYRKYTKEEVTLVYQHQVKFPTLIQAGVPHNVTTYSEPRMCVSLFLMHTATDKYISFSEGLELFKTHS